MQEFAGHNVKINTRVLTITGIFIFSFFDSEFPFFRNRFVYFFPNLGGKDGILSKPQTKQNKKTATQIKQNEYQSFDTQPPIPTPLIKTAYM
jgi:hypothetical protein